MIWSYERMKSSNIFSVFACKVIKRLYACTIPSYFLRQIFSASFYLFFHSLVNPSSGSSAGVSLGACSVLVMSSEDILRPRSYSFPSQKTRHRTRYVAIQYSWLARLKSWWRFDERNTNSLSLYQNDTDGLRQYITSANVNKQYAVLFTARMVQEHAINAADGSTGAHSYVHSDTSTRQTCQSNINY